MKSKSLKGQDLPGKITLKIIKLMLISPTVNINPKTNAEIMRLRRLSLYSFIITIHPLSSQYTPDQIAITATTGFMNAFIIGMLISE
jgi:hypothetical protein